MPHYTEQQIEVANNKSLVAFLNSHGEQLKKFGAQHLWEKHQVWIRDNRWYTHYDAAGGYAISFVMKYYAMDFQNAVAELLGGGIAVCSPPAIKEQKSKELVIPKANTTMNRVYAYLMNERFISREVISFFAHERTLYEDEQYHNCIFVGVDENGIPKHIHRRGTHGSFKQTESGSRAEYSFHHDGESEWLFVFEAPIDMLAFITLHQKEWTRHSYVALALFGGLGVAFVSKNWKISIMPILLMLILFIAIPALNEGTVGIMVPVSALFTIATARIMYKKGAL